MPVNSSSRFEEAPQRRSPIFRTVIVFGAILLMGIIFSIIELVPRLSHVNISILSGPKSEQYFNLVDNIATEATNHGGTVNNFSTTGSAVNIKRLLEASGSGESLFFMVPDGVHFTQPEKLELVARLPKLETVFFLGIDANSIHYLSDLKYMRIGIGPSGSGTALIGREILGAKDLKGLNITLMEHTFSEQVEKLKNGDLDLGVFVTSENNPLIRKAVYQGLKIASFMNAPSWTKRYPAMRVETLYAGYFDHVKLLPKTKKTSSE